jgi:hypothetical protein
MAIIEKKLVLAGSKAREEVVALFDLGATYSCIRPDLAEKLGSPETTPEAMEFGTAKEGERMVANQRVSLNFYLNGYRFSDEFMVIPGLSAPVLIGAATLQKWRMKLDFENDEVIIDPRVTILRLLFLL